jgi:hypothetical protein
MMQTSRPPIFLYGQCRAIQGAAGSCGHTGSALGAVPDWPRMICMVYEEFQDGWTVSCLEAPCSVENLD